jgi:PAS domain S-box-containing protein
MSLKSRLLALLVTTLLLIALTISAVDLDGLVSTFVDTVRERTDFTAQQVKTILLQRLNEAAESRQFTKVDQAKIFWIETLSTDSEIPALLQRTMAPSKVVVEISIARDDGVILASTSPAVVGKPMVRRPGLHSLQGHNALRRFLETIRSRTDYEVRVPVGIETTPPTPVFEIQVLVSSVLQRSTLLPHLQRVAGVSALAVIGAIFLSLVAASLALRPLETISQRIDQIAAGKPMVLAPPGTSTKEFAVVQSKLNLLGEQYRGAQQLIENLQEAILLIDSEGRIILAGEPAQRLLGIGRTELVGRQVPEALPATTELGALLQKALHLQIPLSDRSVTWDRRGQDALRLLVNLEILPGSNERANERGGAMVTLRDAEGRRQVQSQLDLSERLAAISRITGGVAHEIKNPLNAIALRLEVLRARIGHDMPESNQELDIIAEEVTRLDRVVKTFLDFTRPVQLALADVDLKALLEEIAHFVEPEAAQSNVQVNFVVEPGAAFIMQGDRDLLKQGFLNVVMNGIEAMAESGGALRIKIESLLSSRQGRQAVIGISDAGPGIPADQKDKVFQLYFTTKSKGSGIGLAIAFRVAQLHGGKIEFSSNPRQGTTFIFLLPLSEAKGRE